MTTFDELDRIAAADVTVEEARSILQSVFKRKSRDLSKNVGNALRAWVWKTLTSRRSDRELEDWHGLFEQVRIRVAETNADCATRISVLGELIYESIASADISDPKLVLQRSHTRELLKLLADTSEGRMERSQLKAHLGLQEANLTRVINMLLDAGLVSKIIEGKRVIVEITKAGEREIGNSAIRQPAARDTITWTIGIGDPTEQVGSLSEKPSDEWPGPTRITLTIPRDLSNPAVTYHHREAIFGKHLRTGEPTGPYKSTLNKGSAGGPTSHPTHNYVALPSPDPFKKTSGQLSYARQD